MTYFLLSCYSLHHGFKICLDFFMYRVIVFDYARFCQSRLKNIDQNSEQQMEVTVGNVTVIITDYKLLPVKDEKSPPPSPQQPEQVVPVDNEQIDKTSDTEKKDIKENGEEQEVISS